MTRTRRTAISYSRYSDPKQSKGDSENRQASMFRDFCQRHNLTPLTEVFADRGRSGYHDAHRKKGRLGQLIEAAKEGRFDPGTVIVVEAWDRLGRLRPDKQTALVAELLGTGVAIGVCQLGDVFEEADFGSHKWTALSVFIQLAHQESKQKAERVAASWKARRQKAHENGEQLGCLLPAWLEKDKAGAARLIPERAAVVRRIFELAAAGNGHTRIVAALQREGVKPFGKPAVRPGRIRSQFSGKWTRPYVALVLTDRRAVGELQPRTADGKPAGPPLVGYYPAAVSEDLFLLARAAKERRTTRGQGTPEQGTRQRRYVNIFRGVMRHARDGEGFALHNKGSATKPELILVNASAEGGRGQYYTIPYPGLERAILGKLRELKPKDVTPAASAEPDRTAVLRAKLKNVRADVTGLQAELKGGFSKALAAVLREKEEEETRLADALQDELARTVRPAAKAWGDVDGLVGLLEKAEDPDAVRLRIRVALQQCVEDMRLLIVPRGATRLCAVQVAFQGGAVRSYIIRHRTAGNRRTAEWEVLSDVFADGEAPDLRTAAGVKTAERVLAEVAAELNGKV